MSRMVLNGVVLASLIAGSSFSSAASAATPTITSAQLTDSTVVISGANFGTKAVAAPFFYQDFTTNNGVKDADLLIGYANQRQYSSTSYGSFTTVDTSLGRTPGRGALKLDIAAGAADYFPHVSLNTSNTGRGTLTSQSTDELFISYWVKSELVSGTPSGNLLQIKAARSGTGGPSTDYYRNYPLYVSSMYPRSDASGYTGTYQETRNSSGTTSSGEHFDTANISMWRGNGWNFVEIWQKYNTPGIADGFFRYRINGVNIDDGIASASLNSILVRNSGDGAKHFDYTMLAPGVDIPGNTSTGKYRLLFSEHYVDTTPQRVMIGNASTLSASTGGLLCPPISWNNGSITVTAENIPAGYQWVYVVNNAGETNPTGFPLSNYAAPRPTPPSDVTVVR